MRALIAAVLMAASFSSSAVQVQEFRRLSPEGKRFILNTIEQSFWSANASHFHRTKTNLFCWPGDLQYDDLERQLIKHVYHMVKAGRPQAQIDATLVETALLIELELSYPCPAS